MDKNNNPVLKEIRQITPFSYQIYFDNAYQGYVACSDETTREIVRQALLSKVYMETPG